MFVAGVFSDRQILTLLILFLPKTARYWMTKNAGPAPWELPSKPMKASTAGVIDILVGVLPGTKSTPGHCGKSSRSPLGSLLTFNRADSMRAFVSGMITVDRYTRLRSSPAAYWPHDTAMMSVHFVVGHIHCGGGCFKAFHSWRGPKIDTGNDVTIIAVNNVAHCSCGGL